ncbi:adenylate/guanylate cyclase domain-containing protein [Tumidithrix elongata RA019]|uniref:Adenylate/guanylate cyclase domain-containing protein n=1 Tax=Tumidithrix elongata BACA0141 TaxID=2716417 RepID=A0AAW9Q8D3_9CYAN|nr:adenylate/guanylate cyclase domain-containing protein [Tumidithrix elongata RA019]
MKPIQFASLRVQIMLATVLLVALLVFSGTWLLVSTERELYYHQLEKQAKALSMSLAGSFRLEMVEDNWGNIRLRTDELLRNNSEYVYAFVSDPKKQNRIIVASPAEFEEKYIPNPVPFHVTKLANTVQGEPIVTETFLLRDIANGKDALRGKKGERIIEASAGIIGLASEDKTKPVLGIFRLGISLRTLDEAIAQAIYKSLGFGAIGLGLGLVGAYLLAERISKPILRLRTSAAVIAAGDLSHRAKVDKVTELATLAKAFNNMSETLQDSFGKLQKTLESFERFVPEKFLKAIAPQGIENIKVGEFSEREVSILFADIRDYTAMSEKMTPMEVFDFLNEYLDCMGRAIERSGGFIDKYIGDAIMAIFDDEYADRALNAAIDMLDALKEFNRDRAQRGLVNIDIGIGIHHGKVIMGTVGFRSRIDSTVIGDAVNLASRIESLTKYYKSQILVTSSVIDALHQSDRFDLRIVDSAAKIKGKENAITLYAVEATY